MPYGYGLPYGGSYGGYGSGYGSELAAGIRGPDFAGAMEEGMRLNEEQQLLPYEMQAKREQAELQTQDYGNAMLAQVARSASAADPQDAAGIWDRGMQRLSQQGVDAASQYVGHYRPDLAGRVLETYGAPQGKNGQTQAAGPYDPQMLYQRMSSLNPAQLQSAVKNQNAVISAFNGIKDETTWNAAIGQLKNMGIPVGQMLGSEQWSPLNYANAWKIVQGVTQQRDVAQNLLASRMTPGIDMSAPPTMTGTQTWGISGYDNMGRPIYYDRRNPALSMTGPQQTAPKPGSASYTFDMKRQAYLQVHPDDADGALQFANGKKQLSQQELTNMAETRANQELGDATLAGQQIQDPVAWQKNRVQEIMTEFGATPNAPSGTTPGRPTTTGPAARRQMSQGDIRTSIANAKAAIAAKPWARQEIIRRMQAAGIPTQGL